MSSQNTQQDINTKSLSHVEKWSDLVGNIFVSIFHRITLFGIGAATVWSSAETFLMIFQKGTSSIRFITAFYIFRNWCHGWNLL